MRTGIQWRDLPESSTGDKWKSSIFLISLGANQYLIAVLQVRVPSATGHFSHTLIFFFYYFLFPPF